MSSILRRLAHLNIDRAKGAAPHKPLLLLCLLEIAEEGGLSEELMPVTGELAFRFISYWAVVAHRRPMRPDIKLPLFHMKSDRFWHPLDEQHAVLRHRELPAFLRFDSEFLTTVNDPALRTQAREIIIRNYFEPNEQASLWALTGHDAEPTETADLNIQYTDREAVERGREGRFRIGVVTAYNYTCALTGYRLVTLSSGTIVDACHIHQFANSRNNDLNNGISLSKNAHWLFDKGLWSLRDDYSVVVAERHFAEAGDSAILLSCMKNKIITLPADPGQWPALKHLQWHRNHKFLGS